MSLAGIACDSFRNTMDSECYGTYTRMHRMRENIEPRERSKYIYLANAIIRATAGVFFE